MPAYSKEYIDLFTAGPFPDQMDPWVEAGRFFQQLHAQMIGLLLSELGQRLIMMGYVVGRETSLQIAENRQPDLYIHRPVSQGDETAKTDWNYSQAAKEILAEPGVILEGIEPEMDAVYIRDMETNELVTVIEIISPRNKTETNMIREYQDRRMNLLHRNVNVVEIDLTRSVKRLVDDIIVDTVPYHIAVYLPKESHRFIPVNWGESLKRVAIPLREDVTPVDLHDTYRLAYQQTSIAWHIHGETGYVGSALPFLSLISEPRRQQLMQQVTTWQEKLNSLR